MSPDPQRKSVSIKVVEDDYSVEAIKTLKEIADIEEGFSNSTEYPEYRRRSGFKRRSASDGISDCDSVCSHVSLKHPLEQPPDFSRPDGPAKKRRRICSRQSSICSFGERDNLSHDCSIQDQVETTDKTTVLLTNDTTVSERNNVSSICEQDKLSDNCTALNLTTLTDEIVPQLDKTDNHRSSSEKHRWNGPQKKKSSTRKGSISDASERDQTADDCLVIDQFKTTNKTTAPLGNATFSDSSRDSFSKADEKISELQKKSSENRVAIKKIINAGNRNKNECQSDGKLSGKKSVVLEVVPDSALIETIVKLVSDDSCQARPSTPPLKMEENNHHNTDSYQNDQEVSKLTIITTKKCEAHMKKSIKPGNISELVTSEEPTTELVSPKKLKTEPVSPKKSKTKPLSAKKPKTKPESTKMVLKEQVKQQGFVFQRRGNFVRKHTNKIAKKKNSKHFMQVIVSAEIHAKPVKSCPKLDQCFSPSLTTDISAAAEKVSFSTTLVQSFSPVSSKKSLLTGFQKESEVTDNQKNSPQSDSKKIPPQTESQKKSLQKDSQKKSLQTDSQKKPPQAESQKKSLQKDSQKKSLRTDSQKKPPQAESQEKSLQKDSQKKSLRTDSQKKPPQAESQKKSLQKDSQKKSLRTDSPKKPPQADSPKKPPQADSQKKSLQTDSPKKLILTDAPQKSLLNSQEQPLSIDNCKKSTMKNSPFVIMLPPEYIIFNQSGQMEFAECIMKAIPGLVSQGKNNIYFCFNNVVMPSSSKKEKLMFNVDVTSTPFKLIQVAGPRVARYQSLPRMSASESTVKHSPLSKKMAARRDMDLSASDFSDSCVAYSMEDDAVAEKRALPGHDQLTPSGEKVREGGAEEVREGVEKVPPTSSFSQWTCQDVQNWLMSHGLARFVNDFLDLDGKSLVELVQFFTKDLQIIFRYLEDMGCDLVEKLTFTSMLRELFKQHISELSLPPQQHNNGNGVILRVSLKHWTCHHVSTLLARLGLARFDTKFAKVSGPQLEELISLFHQDPSLVCSILHNMGFKLPECLRLCVNLRANIKDFEITDMM